MNANLPARMLLATDGSEDASAATRAAEGPVLFHPQAPDASAPPVREVREGAGDGASFWDTLFDDRYRSRRQERVLDYVVHRVGDGARLRDVVREEYVRRLASPSEIEDIIQNPRLVETARTRMQEELRNAE